jgi:hypothetical protein
MFSRGVIRPRGGSVSVSSGFPGDFLKRLRKLRPRNTIAVPVVSILLLITLGIFTAGYYINKSVFYTTTPTSYTGCITTAGPGETQNR